MFLVFFNIQNGGINERERVLCFVLFRFPKRANQFQIIFLDKTFVKKVGTLISKIIENN